MTVRWKLIQGYEKRSKFPVKILFSGSDSDFAYVTKMIFDDGFKILLQGKFTLWFFMLVARSNIFRCDLMLFQYKRDRSVSIKKNEFQLPLWVGRTVSLPLSLGNESVKSDVRTIIKNNLSYRVTSSKKHIEKFVDDFWVPTVKKRYPEKNIDKEIKQWKDYECELLLVNDGADDISGALLRYDQGGPYLWRNGLKNGDLSLWKTGGIAATYYFSAEYLFSKGYQSLYLGLARAFLRDGLFQYKKKWGGVLSCSNNYAFILKIFRDSNGIRHFLMNNPFFSYSKGKICSSVFYDESRDCDEKTYHFNGVDGVKCINIDEFLLNL